MVETNNRAARRGKSLWHTSWQKWKVLTFRTECLKRPKMCKNLLLQNAGKSISNKIKIREHSDCFANERLKGSMGQRLSDVWWWEKNFLLRIIIGKEFKALYRGETPFDKTENIRFKTGRRNSAHRKSRGAEKYLCRLIAREQVGREGYVPSE